jgi:hypothetical protein
MCDVVTSFGLRQKDSLGMHWLSPGRVLFFGCALLACCSVTVAQNPPGGGGSRPNILFVMADDHGYQAISAYGSKINRTPNIDRLAKEGMRFDRCFVTNSVCGPSCIPPPATASPPFAERR